MRSMKSCSTSNRKPSFDAGSSPSWTRSRAERPISLVKQLNLVLQYGIETKCSLLGILLSSETVENRKEMEVSH